MTNSNLIVAGSGHRLGKRLADERSPTGYEDNIEQDLLKLARGALKHYKPSHVISGGAIGWDIALAQAAAELNIAFTLAIPFIGFDKVWPEKHQNRLRWLMEVTEDMHRAEFSEAIYEDEMLKIELIEEYEPGIVVIGQGLPVIDAYHERNTWMVDHCDLLLLLWDKQPGGGTAHTNKFAKQKGVNTRNLWKSWKKGRIATKEER